MTKTDFKQNKCIGNDTKAAVCQSLNCIKTRAVCLIHSHEITFSAFCHATVLEMTA